MTCTLWNTPASKASAAEGEPEQQDVVEDSKSKKSGKKQDAKQSKDNKQRKESKQKESAASKTAKEKGGAAKGKPGAKDKKGGDEEAVPADSEPAPALTPSEDGVCQLWFGLVQVTASQTFEVTIVNPTIAHAFWEMSKEGTKGEPLLVLPAMEVIKEKAAKSPPRVTIVCVSKESII